MGHGDFLFSGQNAGFWVGQEARRIGISVSQLCKRARVSLSTVNRWKNGHTQPYIMTIRQIQGAIASIEQPPGSPEVHV